ncbi:FKBP-type peptidyl-prolyl cis-trans isomerase [Aeromicrobium sp. Root495]|uniref:FKBP-type peptidyl-prolyl cis-trans isomerase n=1 Tax=Aeromicrobium sp. Root495 TaxID=1736550 RepID=UPI0012E7612B|nr:FKBP-type peptidyl-prolyl cis-trans isomerase [Aeromicrobium sp. Root495]
MLLSPMKAFLVPGLAARSSRPLQIALVGVVSALVLSACGSDSSGLGSVKVSSGKTPTVTVAKDYTTTATETKVVAEGSGEKLETDDVVKLNYVAVNGRTGKQFDNSFKTGSPISITLKEGSILDGFVKGLTGQKIGSRVLVAIPPKDGFPDGQEQLGVKKTDTLVFLFDIVAKVPSEASGQAKKLPADVPELVLKDGKPSAFKKTSSSPKMVKKASSHVVIQGTGPAVKAGQTLNVQYLGQVYPGGSTFDSSWDRGQSASLSLDSVIECWKTQLPGQKVGSRVVLECPSATAYGKQGSGEKIKGGDDLLFAIDILDAS